MIHLLDFLLLLIGFAALALTTKRYDHKLIGRRLSDRERLLSRIIGWVLIAGALTLAMARFGPAYGAIAWFGYMSIAAWSVVAVLCLKARSE